jgi:hypothetical protein
MDDTCSGTRHAPIMSSTNAGRLNQIIPLADGLAAAARATTMAARKVHQKGRRIRKGATLHPGPDTPLWNELATAVEKALQGRGEKAKLARLLGLHRQRLHVLLVTRASCPDAERTLQLLAWLQSRRQGVATA